jgi:hypothetical protein
LSSLTVAGTVTGTYLGDGGNLSNLNASNLNSGTVPTGRLSGNYNISVSGSAGTAGLAATVSANAQPNITSVGTLTSLAVTGNAAAGNISTGGTLTVTGNGTVGNIFTTRVSASANIVGANLVVSESGSVLHSVNPAVTAVGSVQADATALSNDVNVITVAGANTGVVLPPAVPGMRKLVFNTTANSCIVYPALGSQINSLGTNVGYVLTAGTRLEYVATGGTQWYTLNATYA